jgi:hypothetical protein
VFEYVPLVLVASLKVMLVSFYDVVSDVFVVCHCVLLLWLFDIAVLCVVF